jgi:hypothetical protein
VLGIKTRDRLAEAAVRKPRGVAGIQPPVD